MSIDYDRLRQLVAEMEQGTAATTRYTWLDLARELLRLRDGVEQLRKMCLRERDAAFHATPMCAGEVVAFNACADQLTELLKGDRDI